jgi:hypothetical protein
MKLKVVTTIYGDITDFCGVTPCILEVHKFLANLLPQTPYLFYRPKGMGVF